jgi:hypothetical protein
MRIAASPPQQASLSRQAIWWRGGGDLAFQLQSDRNVEIHQNVPINRNQRF